MYACRGFCFPCSFFFYVASVVRELYGQSSHRLKCFIPVSFSSSSAASSSQTLSVIVACLASPSPPLMPLTWMMRSSRMLCLPLTAMSSVDGVAHLLSLHVIPLLLAFLPLDGVVGLSTQKSYRKRLFMFHGIENRAIPWLPMEVYVGFQTVDVVGSKLLE